MCLCNVAVGMHRKRLMMRADQGLGRSLTELRNNQASGTSASMSGLQQNEANSLTETIRLRIPKIAFQAEACEDGTYLVELRTPRVFL